MQTPIIDGGSASAPAAPTKKAAPKPAKKTAAPPATSTQYTARTWAMALLGRLGAPTTPANIQAITSWEQAEGGHWNNTAYFNPLNTTQDAPGSTSMNDVGVKAYTSWGQGLAATVQTLQSHDETGKLRYGSILAALQHGSDPNAVANAVVNSPWGTHTIKIGNYRNYGNQSVDTTQRTVASSGTMNPQQPLTVQQYLDNQHLQSQYGYLMGYLKDPELGPILAKAAQQGWGEDQLLGAITKTHWWKTTSDTARVWQEQQRIDPAAAKQRLSQTVDMIQQESQKTLGRPLDAKRAQQIANSYIGQGWTAPQLQAAIGAEFHYNPAQPAYGGAAGQTLDTLRKNASDYMVPISDQTLQTWTQGILKGTYKDTDFNDYLKTQALSLYPTLASALNSGITTKTYLTPYAEAVRNTLGINPDGLNWMDPKWSKALNTTTPDGQRAPMSLSDWGTYLRSTPDYQYTDEAKNNAADLASQLVSRLGKVQL